MKHLIKIFFLCLLTYTSISQPSITWQRLYNGPYNSNDYGFDICYDNNNYFYIAGTTNFNQTYTRELYIFKINSAGDTIWTKSLSLNVEYGGSIAKAITSTMDGGCVISGESDSCFALKLNNDGSIAWFIKYNNNVGVNIRDIINTVDGGFLACGSTSGVSYAFKINSNGVRQWQYIDTSIYGSNYYSIVEAIDGGYILAGNKLNIVQHKWQVLLTKFSITGSKIWEKSFYISNNSNLDVKVETIKKTTKGYVISGMCPDTILPYNEKAFFASLDINGNKKYMRLFNSNESEEFDYMNVINDNRFVFAFNYWHVDDTAYVRTLICDSLGNSIINKYIKSNGYAQFHSILPMSNGDLIFVGDANFTGSYFSNSDVYIVRSDNNLNFPPIGIRNLKKYIPTEFKLYQNYPNPFNPITKIKYDIPNDGIVSFVVYDILGREIYSNSIYRKAGVYELDFDGSSLASGLYFYKIESGKYAETKKMVLIK